MQESHPNADSMQQMEQQMQAHLRQQATMAGNNVGAGNNTSLSSSGVSMPQSIPQLPQLPPQQVFSSTNQVAQHQLSHQQKNPGGSGMNGSAGLGMNNMTFPMMAQQQHQQLQQFQNQQLQSQQSQANKHNTLNQSSLQWNLLNSSNNNNNSSNSNNNNNLRGNILKKNPSGTPSNLAGGLGITGNMGGMGGNMDMVNPTMLTMWQQQHQQQQQQQQQQNNPSLSQGANSVGNQQASNSTHFQNLSSEQLLLQQQKLIMQLHQQIQQLSSSSKSEQPHQSKQDVPEDNSGLMNVPASLGPVGFQQQADHLSQPTGLSPGTIQHTQTPLSLQESHTIPQPAQTKSQQTPTFMQHNQLQMNHMGNNGQHGLALGFGDSAKNMQQTGNQQLSNGGFPMLPNQSNDMSSGSSYLGNTMTFDGTNPNKKNEMPKNENILDRRQESLALSQPNQSSVGMKGISGAAAAALKAHLFQKSLKQPQQQQNFSQGQQQMLQEMMPAPRSEQDSTISQFQQQQQAGNQLNQSRYCTQEEVQGDVMGDSTSGLPPFDKQKNNFPLPQKHLEKRDFSQLPSQHKPDYSHQDLGNKLDQNKKAHSKGEDAGKSNSDINATQHDEIPDKDQNKRKGKKPKRRVSAQSKGHIKKNPIKSKEKGLVKTKEIDKPNDFMLDDSLEPIIQSDPTFSGGWQSDTGDMRDRRTVILSIVKVIEMMRPDANKMTQKLPVMAKKLEEHLYRSAPTKEEYTDPISLKKRLQMIAHGLGVRKTGDGNEKEKQSDHIPTGKVLDVKIENISSCQLQNKALSKSWKAELKNLLKQDSEQSEEELTKNKDTSNQPKELLLQQQMQKVQQQIQMSSGSKPSPLKKIPVNHTLSNTTNQNRMIMQLQQQFNMIKQKKLGMQQGSLSNDLLQQQHPPLPQKDATGTISHDALNQLQQQQIGNKQKLNYLYGANTAGCNLPASPSPQGVASNTNSTLGGKRNLLMNHQQKASFKPQTNVPGGIPTSLSYLTKKPSMQETPKLQNSDAQNFQANGQSQQSQAQIPSAVPSAAQAQLPNALFIGPHAPKTLSATVSDDSDIMSNARKDSTDNAQRKNVRDRQHRLLLLRHASKCTAGASCKTQSCPKIVTLWKHMKRCRDKNCATPHCVSSRFVLSHYRLCKKDNGTATCEVCAPVMKQIRLQSSKSGDQSDPFGGCKEVDPLLEDGISVGGTDMPSSCSIINPTTSNASSNNQLTVMKQQLSMSSSPQTTLQLQIQASLLQKTGKINSDFVQHATQFNQAHQQQQQLQQQQVAQHNLLLQQLQLQKSQIQEQQKHLLSQQQNVKPHTPQAQKLQHQQSLLLQLQQQFQHQEQMVKIELQRSITQGQLASQQGRPPHLNETIAQEHSSSASAQAEDDVSKGESSTTSKLKRNSTTKRSRKNTEKAVHPTSTPKVPVRGNPGKKTLKGKRIKKVIKEEPSAKPLRKKQSSSSITPLPQGAIEDTNVTDQVNLKKHSNVSGDRESPKLKKAKTQLTTENISSQMSMKPDKASSNVHLPIMPDRSASDEICSNPMKLKEGTLFQQQPSCAQANNSLIPSMSVTSIENHLESLNPSLHITPRRIMEKSLPIIEKLLDHPYGWVFRDPVNPDELGIPDYFDVVKIPMDLSLVKKKLENCEYNDMESVDRETKLVFENSILYNGEKSDVGDMAKMLLNMFKKEFKLVMKDTMSGRQLQKQKYDICTCCGYSQRQFEPTVIYCSGPCGMKPIKRNSVYYTDSSRLNHWCVPCYSKLGDTDPITQDGKTAKKNDLQKVKNNVLAEEGWVQCDTCKGWVHQICALFNGRKNKTTATYTCPKCHIAHRKKKFPHNPDKSLQQLKGAKGLPASQMSDKLEEGLHDRLKKEYKRIAEEEGCPVNDVEKVTGLHVRVLCNVDKKHRVGDETRCINAT